MEFSRICNNCSRRIKGFDDLVESGFLSLTWNRGSQGNKHHGGHSVTETHGAAKVWRQISNDGGEEANDADGH